MLRGDVLASACGWPGAGRCVGHLGLLPDADATPPPLETTLRERAGLPRSARPAHDLLEGDLLARSASPSPSTRTSCARSLSAEEQLAPLVLAHADPSGQAAASWPDGTAAPRTATREDVDAISR